MLLVVMLGTLRPLCSQNPLPRHGSAVKKRQFIRLQAIGGTDVRNLSAEFGKFLGDCAATRHFRALRGVAQPRGDLFDQPGSNPERITVKTIALNFSA